ncbi:MAG: hypothetical protein WC699_09450 [Bacteroidales bacterium]|jgi:hypothetical protein
MFNSVALNVVIGLVFIFLLYSLLATVVSEMIASLFGLRARNLKIAVSRMLNDERMMSPFRRLLVALNIMKSDDGPVVNELYANPEIKYLGSLHRNPSSIRPESFSKAMLDILIGDKKIKGLKTGRIEPESAVYIRELWEEAETDVNRFRVLLENWFNRTMDQASEWYKRKIQLLLLVLGFCLAWFFYADTFVIVQKLSADSKAREQMVSLAGAFVRSGVPDNDTSLLHIKRKLDADIAGANTILGLGGWLPDQVRVTSDPVTRDRAYSPALDPASLPLAQQRVLNGVITFSPGDKIVYLFRLAYHHFFGFLLTAIAISLGAPFWFDLLNKIMRLRTSKKIKTEKA